MSSPTGPTDIANLAVDIISTQNIEDVEMPGDDEIASVMNRWYDITRLSCLEGFPWVFASRRISIPLVDPAPESGYSDQYELPNDYRSLNWITDESLPLSQWDYTIENGKILIDNGGAESLVIGYVFDCQDVPKFSAKFILYPAHELAAKTALKLTKNIVLAGKVAALVQPVRLEAQAINGKMNPPKAYRESAMLRARRRNAG